MSPERIFPSVDCNKSSGVVGELTVLPAGKAQVGHRACVLNKSGGKLAIWGLGSTELLKDAIRGSACIY